MLQVIGERGRNGLPAESLTSVVGVIERVGRGLNLAFVDPATATGGWSWPAM